MKKILLLVAVLAMGKSMHAQRILIKNESPCDVRLILHEFNTPAPHVTPTGNTATYLVPAGTVGTQTMISTLAWRSGAPGCGSQVGAALTEDPACGGSAATTVIASPTNLSSEMYTTCSSNPGCPPHTNVTVSMDYFDHFSYPSTPPPPCMNPTLDPHWDVEVQIH